MNNFTKNPNFKALSKQINFFTNDKKHLVLGWMIAKSFNGFNKINSDSRREMVCQLIRVCQDHCQ